MSIITMKQLLEAGAHFGHQTRKWNPKMAPYIFSSRNNIHILDLQKTLKLSLEVYNYVRDLVASGKKILFVGTKRQAQEAIQLEAERCGMSYINQRWWGGVLTNFHTIRNSIKRLKDLEEMETTGRFSDMSKKEVSRLRKEKNKLDKGLRGIKNMDQLPDAVFIIDPMHEEIAVAEARKLGIPIVAVIDTDCDPDRIDHVIPANDDAIRAIKLLVKLMSDAVLEGLELARKKGVSEDENQDVQGSGDEEATSGTEEEN